MDQQYSGNDCYHCGLPIPANTKKSLEVLGKERLFCCEGCYAVADMIVTSKLDDYYKFRTETADKPEHVTHLESELAAYDQQQVQEDYLLDSSSETEKSVLLYSEQVRCSACAWLIERKINKLNGVNSVQVNVTSQVIHLKWRPEDVALSTILKQLHHLGYTATPYKPEDTLNQQKITQKSWLKRLGMAGLGMMQVMMFAVALYLGAFSGMAEEYEWLIRAVSFLIATPVLFYAGYPFYSSGVASLRNKQLNMDVPITLALFIAYGASIWALFTSGGEVYFDSVTMFVFFLLIGRYIEFRVRQQISERIYKGSAQKLNHAEKYDALTGETEAIAIKAIEDGDMLLVRAGKSVAVDGELVSEQAELNVSMLNGEFLPAKVDHGQTVLAGSINTHQPFVMRARVNEQGNYWQKLLRLQEAALLDKPKIGLLADKIARYFVAGILLIATGVAFYWVNAGSEDALWITLSVLVVSCPCALSLATPIAMTCGTLAYNQRNILVKGQSFLQASSEITDIVFDKTGTLTRGQLSVDSVEVFGSLTEQKALQIIAALEAQSEHPIGLAFKTYETPQCLATNVHFIPFKGVTGDVEQTRYTFGNADCIREVDSDFQQQASDLDALWLMQEKIVVAKILLKDTLRAEAKEISSRLKEQGFKLHLLSGDPSSQVEVVSQQLNLDCWKNNAQPEDKLSYVKLLQENGSKVLMVGDGINDAPVMSIADASMAMADAADMTRVSADCYLLSDNLSDIDFALNKSKQTQSVIKQNLLWALVYNVTMIPVAAMGFIPPYLAALGMSFSSVVVVINSLRLKK
ncbi:heavy metal translocating P-type ATPase [Kangiella sediminilitoris]|uniref:Heavy metal translocating P-type ATPase n=1 Tax=Kangiella sediminilitoris TaxID=1144748 RepID=A0A1B3BCW7_9GAMM|nr:heavy metal translocating P-type ATPase [Kangiella sediminilitoris]AOE50598.1 Heavy metal translocating P-type ATPase [Kangiella sediminilitoris]